ncbi:MAG TPA: DUF434 domain-containing protein [Blastocatellia bacterium]|nr:DUF434 domain-containing protein [Blastocatellia bacterium]
MDNSRHRGAHPEDEKLFAAKSLPALRQAVADLSWLLNRAYAPAASLKLVGDRFALKDRQRLAVARAACTDEQLRHRQSGALPLENVHGQTLLIDGFNLLITLEAALSGGVLIACRDGCIRDLSSVHGTYRSVAETERALLLVGETLAQVQPQTVTWLLDQPVSNSGRLAARIRELAAAGNWPWTVEVVMNPDKVLRETDQIIITSDSNILDASVRSVNLNRLLIEGHLQQAWLVDLNH